MHASVRTSGHAPVMERSGSTLASIGRAVRNFFAAVGDWLDEVHDVEQEFATRRGRRPWME